MQFDVTESKEREKLLQEFTHLFGGFPTPILKDLLCQLTSCRQQMEEDVFGSDVSPYVWVPRTEWVGADVDKTVFLTCPHCGKETAVTASCYHVDTADYPVYMENGECWIDWNQGYVEGDFDYVCEECGAKLANSLDEVNELRKREAAGEDRTTD